MSNEQQRALLFQPGTLPQYYPMPYPGPRHSPDHAKLTKQPPPLPNTAGLMEGGQSQKTEA